MEEFTFHGPISIDDVVRALEGEFGKGNLRVQIHGGGDFTVVQIASVARPGLLFNSGGQLCRFTSSMFLLLNIRSF